MIKDEEIKKNIVDETIAEILKIEKKELKRLTKSIQSTVVDEIIQKFEEVYKEHDNKGNNDKKL